MSFDDDLRKELQQHLDPISSPAEWEPVRARMAAARAHRNRTRATIASTVALSLALGGIALTWIDRKDPVATASHPRPILPTDDPSPEPSDPRLPFHVEPVDLLLPVNAAAGLPPGRDCPDGWAFFVDPLMHFDVCYPDGWGFVDQLGGGPADTIPAGGLGGVKLLSTNAFPRTPPKDPGDPLPSDVLVVEMERVASDSNLDGCQPDREINIVEATATWCEEEFSSNASDDPDTYHALKALIDLPIPPERAYEEDVSGADDALLFVASAGRAHWDRFQSSAFDILRSIRPHRERNDNEISQALALLSVNGSRLEFQTVSDACGSYLRLEWNETPSSVQVRAVGTRRPADHNPMTQRCLPAHVAQPFIDLEAPLGERRLDFAIVWPDYVVSLQLHCPGRDEYADTPRKGVRVFDRPDRALQAWLREHRPDLTFEELIPVPVGWRDPPGVVRGSIYRSQGRTLGSFYVSYDFDLDGWRIGETAYCL